MRRVSSSSRPVWACLSAFAAVTGLACSAGAATQSSAAFLESKPPEAFTKYCIECHGATKPEADLNIEKLVTQSPIGLHFSEWDSIAEMLETSKMPPDDASEFPTNEERLAALSWVRSSLKTYETAHAGEPGRVTVRRLTSGEYAYAIRDLTGIDIPVGIDASSDSVGGEGFTNFGDVQFVQDTSIERYLEAAKLVGDHAVIGAGPLQFFADAGKSGMELSALSRIDEIYNARGFRVVAAEGGRPFGWDRYGKAFFAAWYYKNRVALGDSKATLAGIARKEGIAGRFAEHVWAVVNRTDLGYPMRDLMNEWKSLPPPTSDIKSSLEQARTANAAVATHLMTWPSWFFARGDMAVGGLGDESPLVFDDTSLKAESTHHYAYPVGLGIGRKARSVPGPMKLYLTVANINPIPGVKPLVVWKNARLVVRERVPVGPEELPTTTVARLLTGPVLSNKTLRSILTPEQAAPLGFGKAADGTTVGPEDFATTESVSFPVVVPEGDIVMTFEADAELGADRNAVIRVLVTDRTQGNPRDGKQRVALGDPTSSGYKTYRAGIAQYAWLLPPNSHGEANPADKDPAPAPFEIYTGPEHDDFVLKVKYQRNDRFLYDTLLEDSERVRLDQAWDDLLGSWPYHDTYLGLLAIHYGVKLKSPHIQDLDAAQIATLPVEARPYFTELLRRYDEVSKGEIRAEKGHIEDVYAFASRAWRRPLTSADKKKLKAFYQRSRTDNALDHDDAIRAVIARVLVSPAFLYRVEMIDGKSERPLDNWEMASRLSFFLWSSIPDDELNRAAAAGELTNPKLLAVQVKRMTADPKARRLATEFFGQWFGFYRFDQFRGVDTGRFPEFTDEIKSSMYDEAVSTFEYVVRNGRPIKEIINADYTFLNQPLAKFYGIDRDIKSKDAMVKVDGANALNRGGVLRLGSVLSITSAPLRTSPVKRGDWVLRRILGTPTPPPPADAGSLPSDPKAFGGLTLRERLNVHKRNATCASCHLRIDPMGFPLEGFDPIGRTRTAYQDGVQVDVTGELADKSTIVGTDGLLKYLQSKDAQVMKTLAKKMLGYALGRTVLASDHALVHDLTAAGGNATFADLATQIVTSRQFRNRQGEEDNQLSFNPNPADSVAGVNRVSQKTQESP